MTWQIKQRVRLGDAQALRAVCDLDHLVAGSDITLFQHTKVEARSMLSHHQSGHLRLVQADADAVARHSGLGNLEESTADPVPVTDTNVIVAQAIDGEVFPELPLGQMAASELALPVTIGIHLIDQYGPVLTSMAGQVSLAVTIDVEPADHETVRHGCLPDSRVDGLGLPRDVMRKPDIDGHKPRQEAPPPPYPRAQYCRSQQRCTSSACAPWCGRRESSLRQILMRSTPP